MLLVYISWMIYIFYPYLVLRLLETNLRGISMAKRIRGINGFKPFVTDRERERDKENWLTPTNQINII